MIADMATKLEAAKQLVYKAAYMMDTKDVYKRQEHNRVMREFAEIASYADITATQRSDVFKSAWFMTVEEHTAIVKAVSYTHLPPWAPSYRPVLPWWYLQALPMWGRAPCS